MLLGLLSAKGAPGVTTAALCLAAAWPGGAVVVEADPAGGDLECWCGPLGEAGLVDLVTRARPGVDADVLRSCAVRVADGLAAVTAPTAEPAARAALVEAGGGPV